MSLVKSGLNWVRQSPPWAKRWSSWQELSGELGVFLVAALLIYLSVAFLALWQSAVAWAVCGLVLAIGSRQGWIKLFGPVLFYDMIRSARRNRYVVVRLIYAGLLLSILCFMYFMLRMQPNQRFERRELALLAESFFSVFMLVQLVLVVLLTPAYVAGAIAEEKDRKTLEFLLATDLRNREIVLSKLLSRLANMTLLLLTGLPILSILQFIGGVDPQLMLAGFAAIGLTMLGIASVSILLSTLFQKPRDAISLTYLMLIAYVSLASFALALQGSRHPLMNVPLWFGDDAPTLNDASSVLNAGNPLALIIDVSMAIGGRNRLGGRTSLASELAGLLERYAWFHLVLSLACVGWSIARLRSIALTQTSGGKTARLRWWQRYRPAVGEYPMLWKEFHVEGRIKLNWLLWLAVVVLVLLTLGTGLWIVGDHLFLNPHQRWRVLSESMNVWFRIAGTSVACLLIVMTGVRASTSITSERERDTFDALLATPISAESILLAKLIGNLTSLRLGWLWFGGMLLLALLTGGVHPLAVPLILGSWFIYSVAFTLVGLNFSMLNKSSLHSAVSTVIATIFLGGGHWLFTGCCCVPVFTVFAGLVLRNHGFEDSLLKFGEYFIKFEAGLTPPFVLGLFAFSWEDLNRGWGIERAIWELVGFSLLGLFLWVLAGAALWFGVLVPQFRQITRRGELIYR